MKRRRWGLARAVLWWVAPAVAVLVLVGPAPAGEDVQALLAALSIGTPPRPLAAPSLTLPDLGGKPQSLADYRGRTVLLYFWTTW
jgi:hypothetical protein